MELSAHRAEPLFPILKRARSLKPLVVVLAILPPLYALENRTFTEGDALWGLRSLQMVQADSFNDLIDAGGSAPACAWRWQPPLGNWLIAAAMWLFGPTSPFSLTLVSFLSTAALIGMIYVLGNSLSGPRFAFWLLILTATHGPILALSQTVAPYGLALLLTAVTIWAYFRHLKGSMGKPVSIDVLLAGIAAGLLLLAGGPLILLILAVLLICSLSFRSEEESASDESALALRGFHPRRNDVSSLLVLGLTGFSLGGWWVLMMASRHGADFWNGWLVGVPHLAESNPFKFVNGVGQYGILESIRKFAELTGTLLGLSVLGLWCACREVRRAANELQRRSLQLQIAWFSCGLAVWLIWMIQVPDSNQLTELWGAFLLVPCLMLSAFAIEQTVERRIAPPVLAATVCFTLWLLNWNWLGRRDASLEAGVSFWGLAAATAIVVIAVAGVCWCCRHRDQRQRLFLSLLVLALVAANGMSGFSSLRVKEDDDRSLWGFRDRMVQIAAIHEAPVEHCVLISTQRPSLRLLYLLRTLWPDATQHVCDGWEQAISLTTSHSDSADVRHLVFVDWGSRDSRPTNLMERGLQVIHISRSEYFVGRQFRSYVLEYRP